MLSLQIISYILCANKEYHCLENNIANKNPGFKVINTTIIVLVIKKLLLNITIYV